MVCPMVAVVMLTPAEAALREYVNANPVVADASPGASAGPDTKQTRAQDAAETLQRDKIRRDIEINIDRLKRCVAATARCGANDFPRLLLGLTRPEVEAILGPPQYELHVAGNHLYYWTVPLAANRPVSAIRVQVSFGDCYYREKSSSKKAVCDATVH